MLKGYSLNQILPTSPPTQISLIAKNHLFLTKAIKSNHATCFIGGLIFLVVFYTAYSLIDNSLYTVRDDGVITMSHAKNWVDYGFIGVGPSGERIEGYSAPLQFIVYTLTYAIFQADYSTFASIQTFICTFLCGFIFSGLFIERKIFSLVATAGSASAMAFVSSFIEWHGSGMENAITHTTFLLTLLTLFTFSRKGEIFLPFAFIPFAASISRLESIYHIFPLVFAFAVYWRIFERSYRGFKFLFLFLAAWVAFQLGRYLYFGDILPNTAYGQNISISDRIRSLVHLEQGFLEQSTHTSKYNFSRHGAFLLLLAVPLLPFLKWSKSTGLLFYLFAIGILTSWFHPYFFGSARLDATRTVSQLAIYVPGVLATLLFMLRPFKLYFFTPLLLPVAAIIFKVNYAQPYGLCCGTDDFNRFRGEFSQVAEQNRITRPTVSNPDLGAMSWHKQFNIVDLGRLGSKIMAKLRGGPLLSEYYYEFAAPDIIETHEWWSCIHIDSIFSDPRFTNYYRPVRNRWARGRGGCQGKRLPVGIWLRKDIEDQAQTPERKLLEDLQLNPDLEVVKQALDSCRKNSNTIDFGSCSYISRSAFRLLPEIREQSNFDDIVSTFNNSPSEKWDYFLVGGYKNPNFDEEALEFILEHFISKYNLQKQDSSGPFEIYLSSEYIVYKNKQCDKSDIKNPIYLHATVKGRSGFTGLDFDFLDKGFLANKVCGAAQKLPPNTASVKTGQWVPKENKSMWENRMAIESP